jgi:hypothetical protein
MNRSRFFAPETSVPPSKRDDENQGIQTTHSGSARVARIAILRRRIAADLAFFVPFDLRWSHRRPSRFSMLDRALDRAHGILAKAPYVLGAIARISGGLVVWAVHFGG